jgi:membrane-bound lytic murein transglycosylase B
MYKLLILIAATILIPYTTLYAQSTQSQANQTNQQVSQKHTPLSQTPEVKKFITQMVTEYHFKRPYLEKIFDQVKLRKKVLGKIGHPFEQVPWYIYKQHFLNPERVNNGVKFWHKYAQTLARAQKKYGVPASIIVAIIGVESNYGKKTGKFLVINALATIAFQYPKRAEYFRKELIQFLLLCRERHWNPLGVYGSYAGAIGQPQFMPSTFRQYAVDFSNSGNIDLNNNVHDVIGSIANFFQAHGWKKGRNIALRARVKKPIHKYFPDNYHEPQFTLSQLTKYHIAPINSSVTNGLMNVIKLQGKDSPVYWLGFHNIYVITFYNTNIQYALAVYQLSQEIKHAYEKSLHKHHRHIKTTHYKKAAKTK